MRRVQPLLLAGSVPTARPLPRGAVFTSDTIQWKSVCTPPKKCKHVSKYSIKVRESSGGEEE